MIKVDNIINPDEVLKKIKPRLISLYEKSYGKEFRRKIKSRWNNTIFLLEGTPEDTKSIFSSIRDKKRLFQYLLEYIDYKRQKKKLERKMKVSFFDYYNRYIEFHPFMNIDDLWNLDFDALPFGEEDEERFLNYKIQCMKLGINPIISEEKLTMIFYMRDALEMQLKVELIKNTLWGKRIQEKAKDVSVEQLADIIFEKNITASTSVVSVDFCEYKTVCFVPLARFIKYPSIDRIMFHELRHVVETEGRRSGLTDFDYPELTLLNEVRTEKNAIKDETQMPIIFGRNSKEIQSVYELILPDFDALEGFDEFLNLIAMTGQMDADEYGNLCKLSENMSVQLNKKKKKKKDE